MDGGPGGPADIRRKIDLYKPHFVMLDSSYMLEMPDSKGSALDWRNLATVTRAIKQVCKTTGVATLAILQENERAAHKYAKSRGTASMAFNTMAGADCDLGFKLVLNAKTQELSLHYAIMREARGNGFTFNAKPFDNFEYSGDHMWEVGDDQEEPPTKAEAAKAEKEKLSAERKYTPALPTAPKMASTALSSTISAFRSESIHAPADEFSGDLAAQNPPRRR